MVELHFTYSEMNVEPFKCSSSLDTDSFGFPLFDDEYLIIKIKGPWLGPDLENLHSEQIEMIWGKGRFHLKFISDLTKTMES